MVGSCDPEEKWHQQLYHLGTLEGRKLSVSTLSNA